jgi:hypothetical protein
MVSFLQYLQREQSTKSRDAPRQKTKSNRASNTNHAATHGRIYPAAEALRQKEDHPGYDAVPSPRHIHGESKSITPEKYGHQKSETTFFRKTTPPQRFIEVGGRGIDGKYPRVDSRDMERAGSDELVTTYDKRYWAASPFAPGEFPWPLSVSIAKA